MDKAIDELPESIRSSELVDRSKKFARVVFRFRDGKVEPVPVSVGPSDLTDTVVTQGVSSEDRVVTGPFKALIALKPEQKVISEEEQKKLDEAKKGIKTADTKEAKPDAGGKAPEAGKS